MTKTEHTKTPIGILALVREVGEDNIAVQNALEHGTFIAANKRKGYTSLEFATYPELAEEMLRGKVRQRVLVLLIDEEKAQAAMSSLRAKADAADGEGGE